MQKRKLVILQAAQNELEEIAAARKELAGKASAVKLIKQLHAAMGHLCSHSQLGVMLEERGLFRQGYRKLICGNYLCFYRVIGDSVTVYHIADGRTEYKRLFRNLPQ